MPRYAAQPNPRSIAHTRNKSWRPGQKGQGGEGMSKGYGGSGGDGTGPSGPETGKTPPRDRSNRDEDSRSQQASDCLPSRERIEQVLR